MRRDDFKAIWFASFQDAIDSATTLPLTEHPVRDARGLRGGIMRLTAGEARELNVIFTKAWNIVHANRPEYQIPLPKQEKPILRGKALFMRLAQL
jgi:hypothetical protein